ncbi:flagellar FlbD family protein [Amphibacillus sediminis]|uniref:flagellar FlbD family protein n=1 Tax=Amphibacillus sediminis TaxID=360185 RepID=UPI0008371AA8|nr:flagellar FlbD family protein [Amphibacillus sediminis]
MIQLTSFKGETFTLNAALIERVQSFPDTTVTLINGKKLVVRETEEEVRQLTKAFYRQIGLIGWQYKVGEEDE